MKFRNYLETIQGIDIYPMIGLLISFVVFLLVIWWAFRLDKESVKKFGSIPIDKNENH